MTQPGPGDMALDFTLPAAGGATLTLSSLRPAPVVLYFYPQDNTPTCTTEANDFQSRLAEFRAAGVHVVGISRDTVAAHDKFCAKQGLSFPLVSDLDGKVCEAWGTWVEKQMYGRTYMGIERATFLIEGQGRIAQAWRKVRIKGHVDAVLAAARTL